MFVIIHFFKTMFIEEIIILYRIGVTGSQSGLRTPAHLVSASGHETPLHYATEGTPANFSRCDSLSSLGTDDEVHDRRGNIFVTIFLFVRFIVLQIV